MLVELIWLLCQSSLPATADNLFEALYDAGPVDVQLWAQTLVGPLPPSFMMACLSLLLIKFKAIRCRSWSSMFAHNLEETKTHTELAKVSKSRRVLYS
jgi:hypothetical protein